MNQKDGGDDYTIIQNSAVLYEQFEKHNYHNV